MQRSKNKFIHVKYCPKCNDDTFHQINIRMDLQSERCLSCGYKSFINYRWLREWITEIKRKVEQNQHQNHILLTSETPNELKSRLISDPCWRHLLVERITAHCLLKTFRALAGVEAGALPILGDVGSRLHKRLILIRKAKKLSEAAVKFTYYNGRGGLKALDNLESGEPIELIEDDTMTGRTLDAAIEVIKKAGGIVTGIACAIEWPEFGGRRLLKGYEVFSSLKAFSSPHTAVEWWKKYGCI